MDRKAIKQELRQMMKGNFWYFGIPCLIIIALFLAGRFFDGFCATSESGTDLRVFFIVLDVVFSITWILINYPIRVGKCRMYLRFLAGEKPKLIELFDDARIAFRILQQTMCYGVVALVCVLGFICGIIPGLLFYSRYCLTTYIYAEDPEALFTDVMKKSAQMMKGHYGELAKNTLSFMGWLFASILTLGFLSLYTEPYLGLFQAKFYLEVKEEYEFKNKIEKLSVEKTREIDKNSIEENNPFSERL